MRGAPLHVEQDAPSVAQALHEPDERDLRRVGASVEHGLAREQPAERDAVDPACELDAPSGILAPGLDAVRDPEPVERDVGLDERLVDPAVWASGIPARAHHRLERLVHRDREPAPRAAERPTDVHTVERHDPPRIGRPPGERPTRSEAHREQPTRVSTEQRRGSEVRADPDDLLARFRVRRIREHPAGRSPRQGRAVPLGVTNRRRSRPRRCSACRRHSGRSSCCARTRPRGSPSPARPTRAPSTS